MPGWSEGIGWAPVVLQVAVRVIVTVACAASDGPRDRFRPLCRPAWPEFSTKLACPLAISGSAAVQPDGSAAMQGRKAAEGTAWAARIIVWLVPHSGACTPGACTPELLAGSSRPTPKTAAPAKMASMGAGRG